MFYSPKLYFRDWRISVPAVAIFLAQIYMWWLLISSVHPDSGQIFLHYNIVFGVDLVGEWWKIFYLPAGGLLMALVNYSVSFTFYDSEKFLARFLAFWALFVHVFLLIAAVLLVRLNV